MGFRKWWKKLSYWKRGMFIGIVFGSIISVLSFFSILIEFNFGSWPLRAGALVFQEYWSCQDVPCALIIIPFIVITLILSTAILGLLIGSLIDEVKKQRWK